MKTVVLNSNWAVRVDDSEPKPNWWLIELLDEKTGNTVAYFTGTGYDWVPVKFGPENAIKFRKEWIAKAFILLYFGQWAKKCMRVRQHIWMSI